MHSPFSATATVSSVGCKLQTDCLTTRPSRRRLPARPGRIEGSDGLDRGTAPPARVDPRCCLASSRSPAETRHLPATDLANCALPSPPKLRGGRDEKEGGRMEGHVRLRLDVTGCRNTGRPGLVTVTGTRACCWPRAQMPAAHPIHPDRIPSLAQWHLPHQSPSVCSLISLHQLNTLSGPCQPVLPPPPAWFPGTQLAPPPCNRPQFQFPIPTPSSSCRIADQPSRLNAADTRPCLPVPPPPPPQQG